MNEELIQKANQQWAQSLEPARKLSTLMVDHLEKVAHLTLDTARAYTDMALEQAQSALEVKDTKSFQEYVSNQSKVVNTVNQKISEDATTLANLGKSFGEEVQKLSQENVTFLSEFSKSRESKPKSRTTSESGSGNTTRKSA